MKRALLSVAIVGLVSLSMTQVAGAQERGHRTSSNRHRVQSNHRVAPRGTVVYGGHSVVYGTPRPSAHRAHYPSHRHHPMHVHRDVYYPRHQRSCAPSYRPPCVSPYLNTSGLGYSNGRVSFWIGF